MIQPPPHPLFISGLPSSRQNISSALGSPHRTFSQITHTHTCSQANMQACICVHTHTWKYAHIGLYSSTSVHSQTLQVAAHTHTPALDFEPISPAYEMSFPQTLKQTNLQEEGKTLLPPGWHPLQMEPNSSFPHSPTWAGTESPSQGSSPKSISLSIDVLCPLPFSVIHSLRRRVVLFPAWPPLTVPSREHPKRCSHRLLQ